MHEVQETGSFAAVMGRFVAQSGYNTCQLARLSGLPRMTLVNWLRGQTKKPRSWQDILRVAQALRLGRNEADEFLKTAGYPTLAQLQIQVAADSDHALLAFWLKEKPIHDRPAPFQAIPDLPTFVGRQAALQKLEGWLSAEQHPAAYVIEGMAGVGKTTLAARLAYRLRPQLPDGVLWARLDATNPLTILRQFAEAYGRDVTSYEDLDSRSQVVREILAHKRALIVLDNVQNSGQIRSLLPPSGSCAVLITTRRRDLFSAHGGRRFQVEPFTKEESLALFVKVLGEENITKERVTLVEIADLVGHLPLAVDITASQLAYVPNWTASDFLVQSRREKGLLDNLVHEDRGVRSAFATSCTQLSPDQRQFFAALGTFGGEDFSVEAAAAVADVTLAVAESNLRMLFCLSLVNRGRSGRYHLIPLLRTFAREKIDQDEPWKRLVDYFIAYTERHEKDIEALEIEKNNILAALITAKERGLSRALERGFQAFSYFLMHHGLTRVDFLIAP